MLKLIYYENPQDVLSRSKQLQAEGYHCIVDNESLAIEGIDPIANVESDVVESAYGELFERLAVSSNRYEKSLIVQSLFSHYPMLIRYCSIIEAANSDCVACFKSLNSLNVFDLAFSFDYEVSYTKLTGESEEDVSLERLVVFFTRDGQRDNTERNSNKVESNWWQCFLSFFCAGNAKNPLKRVIFVAHDNEYNLYLRPYPAIVKELERRDIDYSVFSLNKKSDEFLESNGIGYISMWDMEMLLPSSEQYLSWCQMIADEIYEGSPKDFFEAMRNLALNSATLRDVWMTAQQSQLIESYVNDNDVSDIFFVPDGMPVASQLSDFAAQRQITTHFVLSAGVGEYYRTQHVYFSDEIFCQGAQSKKCLEKFYPAKSLILCGNPNIYSLTQKTLQWPSDQNDKFRILIATSGFDRNECFWMERLAKASDCDSVELILKPHPMYPDRYERIAYAFEGHRMIEAGDDIEPYVNAVDLVITDHSQVGVDAHLLGKPVISMYIGSKEDLYWNDIDSFCYISDVDQLLDTINKIKEKPESIQISNSFIDQHNYGNDDKYYKRIVDHLETRRGSEK